MKLKRYALIAEIVGGLAVIVGLIFVGLELRQNTIMQKVTATQTLVVDYENAIDAIGQDTKIACIYVRGINGLENLNGIERYRFLFCGSTFFARANSYITTRSKAWSIRGSGAGLSDNWTKSFASRAFSSTGLCEKTGTAMSFRHLSVTSFLLHRRLRQNTSLKWAVKTPDVHFWPPLFWRNEQ